MGGTGAGIISYLIDSASSNTTKQTKSDLTYYGSSHLIWPRFMIPYAEIGMPVSQQIQSLLNVDFSFNFDKAKSYTTPTYYAFHCTDLDEVMKYTNKAILINYRLEDATEIATVFLGKRHIDGFYYPNGQRFYTEKDDILKLKKDYITQLNLIIKYQSSFVPRYDYDNKLLNLSWNELINNNPADIIQKLSEFTNIHVDRFDVDTLSEWQKRTHFCISDLEPLVQQLLKEDNE